MLIVTAAEMRTLDRLTIEAGTSGWTLMRRAGKGAAEVLLDALPARKSRRVVVVCGKGNNGGDGFVIAGELKKRGIAVDVFLLGDESQLKGDAAIALQSWRRARGRIKPIANAGGVDELQQRLEGAVWAVDAIFGTGLTGSVNGLAADVITLLNASGVPIFAVDIPSGLDSDRGVPLGCAVQAEITATFAFPKIGQVIHPGVEHCGRLAVVDIGIASEAVAAVSPRATVLDESEVALLVPCRGPEAHKGDCGHVLVIAGSRGKTGAAILCARAAGRAGAGLVTAAIAASQQPIVASGLLECMSEVLPDDDGELAFDATGLERLARDKTIVCGPGIGTRAGARATVRWLIEHDNALVLDADALNCIALQASSHDGGDTVRSTTDQLRRTGKSAALVLTPHPGEMARLVGRSTADVQSDRIGVARSFAAEHGCVLILKGARTVVAAPDGRVAVNPTGNPGMASGGMGDVLAGVVGALLAQKLDAFDAACLGVHLHGHAADVAARERGTIGLLAGDVIEHLPQALKQLSEVEI